MPASSNIRKMTPTGLMGEMALGGTS